jgi:cell wall-associated NlpC family hydrolase
VVAASEDRTTWTRRGWGISRYSLAGALTGCAILALVVVFAIGVGGGSSHHAHAVAKAVPTPSGAGGHPAPSIPHPGAALSAAAGADGGGVHAKPSGHTAGVSVGPDGQVVANEVPDPEAAKSFPAPASVHHKAADTPSKAAEVAVAPGAPSDAEVRRELNQMHTVERQARKQTLTTVPGGGSIGGNGTITPPPGIPAVVARVIAGGNAITDFPYVFGGGHGSFVDNAYDCSGSVSYALAAGGLLSAPETSGTLENWGAAGPGKWITVYANAGHTYMYVNLGSGWMRYDTSGRSGVFASRWQPAIRSNEGFVARHWPGL